MKNETAMTLTHQLQIPGMPSRRDRIGNTASIQVTTGQAVVYVGQIKGGPRYGATGVVRRVMVKRALVDMGQSGAWHIPYYFLSSTKKAA